MRIPTLSTLAVLVVGISVSTASEIPTLIPEATRANTLGTPIPNGFWSTDFIVARNTLADHFVTAVMADEASPEDWREVPSINGAVAIVVVWGDCVPKTSTYMNANGTHNYIVACQ